MSQPDNDKQSKKSSKVETDRRIRTVIDWILDGNATLDIISSCIGTWSISDRQAYTYLKNASKKIEEITKGELEQRLSFHIAARMKLYAGISDKKKPQSARAALDILKDIADLEGFYLQKVDLTTQGNPIHSQDIHTTLVLK